MNAQALKRFVEENQRLADECSNLLVQCQKWEKECSLYDHDREALMDFGNEADERAKVAEGRVLEIEEELASVMEELQFYKNNFESRGVIFIMFCPAFFNNFKKREMAYLLVCLVVHITLVLFEISFLCLMPTPLHC